MDQRATELNERVLATAARLFAELGYDATGLDLIINAVGPEATHSELLRRGKPAVYRAVFEYFHELEQNHFRAVTKELSPDLDGLHEVVDAAVDFAVAHPEVLSLWEQRALKDAMDLDFPEKTFVPPLETVLTSHTWEGVRPEVDLHFLAWSVMWMIMGFRNTGLPYLSGRRRVLGIDPALDYFRGQLHRLVDCYVRAPAHRG